MTKARKTIGTNMQKLAAPCFIIFAKAKAIQRKRQNGMRDFMLSHHGSGVSMVVLNSDRTQTALNSPARAGEIRVKIMGDHDGVLMRQGQQPLRRCLKAVDRLR
ncbi:MAG: hypothetical protein WC612_07120 [Bdellovibrionales bacterium]